MKFVLMLSLLISSAVFAQENIQDLVAEPTVASSEEFSADDGVVLQGTDDQIKDGASIKLDTNEESFDEPVAEQVAVPTVAGEIENEVDNRVEEKALATVEDIPAASEVMPEVEYEQHPTQTAKRGSEVVNLSATIVGNQEQPTVLYIVPWKPAEDTTILYLPLSSKAMEHIFGHVERVEHQRQVQYIDQLDKQ